MVVGSLEEVTEMGQITVTSKLFGSEKAEMPKCFYVICISVFGHSTVVFELNQK